MRPGGGDVEDRRKVRTRSVGTDRPAAPSGSGASRQETHRKWRHRHREAGEALAASRQRLSSDPYPPTHPLRPLLISLTAGTLSLFNSTTTTIGRAAAPTYAHCNATSRYQTRRWRSRLLYLEGILLMRTTIDRSEGDTQVLR